MRKFVQDLQAGAQQAGALPPLTLATLRQKMLQLAAEISQGAVWANAARSHMATSLRVLPPDKKQDAAFFLGNMVPTCISDDTAAASAVLRRTLAGYVRLPNYQNYWIEAGYEDEMLAIRQALAKNETDKVPQLMTDRWLRDVTLFGSAAEVREGIEAWYDTGINTLIVVPSSARGNQMVAFQEVFEALR
jgi:alkanesulfonate monooxygenase SsuD/methylene tetrahydromethanopterin reductase-like flavin-dependent oxidoreductase (luciferase family)